MASIDYTSVKNILSKNGYSWTKPRQAVFKAISKGQPRSITEIINSTKGSVDRVSVYRTVELFEKLGVVHRINIGWRYKLELSDQLVAHHHHLSCTKCGRIIDIEDERHIDNFIKQVAGRFNFEPRRHQFEIEGFCEACSLKSKRQLA